MRQPQLPPVQPSQQRSGRAPRVEEGRRRRQHPERVRDGRRRRRASPFFRRNLDGRRRLEPAVDLAGGVAKRGDGGAQLVGTERATVRLFRGDPKRRVRVRGRQLVPEPELPEEPRVFRQRRRQFKRERRELRGGSEPQPARRLRRGAPRHRNERRVAQRLDLARLQRVDSAEVAEDGERFCDGDARVTSRGCPPSQSDDSAPQARRRSQRDEVRRHRARARLALDPEPGPRELRRDKVGG